MTLLENKLNKKTLENKILQNYTSSEMNLLFITDLSFYYIMPQTMFPQKHIISFIVFLIRIRLHNKNNK